jgi:hypothetical protein
MDKEKEKVVENNENAWTARTQRPNHDYEGEKRAVQDCDYHSARNAIAPTPGISLREACRLSHNLRLEFSSGYVVQPDPNNLSNWRVGKDVDGAVRWFERHGSRESAMSEVQRRLTPTPTPPPFQDEDEDHTADVLNTLICNIDDGKFDLADPDDVDDLECQIAAASDIPETADMAESLLLDLDDGSVTLNDVRQRVDEMLGVLLELEEEMTEQDAWKLLEQNLV